ncbi:MAG: hypothetical protein ACF8OB_13035 [Phycisphaeraceae bacterium JB051]
MNRERNNKSKAPVRFLAGTFCLLAAVMVGKVNHFYYAVVFTASNQEDAWDWSNGFFDFIRGSEYIRSWPGMVMSGLMIGLLLTGVLLLARGIVRK